MIGIVLSGTLLIVIAVLQSLKLIGYPVWPGDQANLFVFFAALIGVVWGLGTFRAKPSVLRAIGGGLFVFAAINLLVMFLRWLLSFADPWSTGTNLFVSGFLMAFGVLWGMGGAWPDYQTVELATAAEERAEHEPPAPRTEPLTGFDVEMVAEKQLDLLKERILPIVRPALPWLASAFGIVLLVILAVMAVGSLTSLNHGGHTQTNIESASATTPVGYVDGLTAFGQPVSKAAFFILLAVLLLGGIGSMGLGLALAMNALSTQVAAAKKMSPEPLDFSETAKSHGPLTRAGRFAGRLVKFFRDWGADITHGARGALSR